MAFDPFGDFETEGYLRNFAGTKTPKIVKELEHDSFRGNVKDALAALQTKSQITITELRETHRILFKDVYPWAGQSRDQNAKDLNITKGPVTFQPAPFIEQGAGYALTTANDPKTFRADVGNTIGELAFNHPFLDGNGRTITTIVDELSRRANFHIKWEQTDKADYLKALTKEIDEPGKKHLSNYLQPFIREGARSVDDITQTLTNLRGFSRPDRETEQKTEQNIQTKQPTLFLVAGPNGAGKSTLTASGKFPNDAKIIDPDAIQRDLSGSVSDAPLTAFREAVKQQREAIDNKQSFVAETTLAGRNGLQLIDAAKQAGFRVEVHFVGLNKVEQSHQRVADRVKTGGHDIPSDTINARFPKIQQHLPEAISKADRTVLYDNSGEARHTQVAELKRDGFSFDKTPPQWAVKAAIGATQLDINNASNRDELTRATQRSYDTARASGLNNEQIKTFQQQAVRNQQTQRQLQDVQKQTQSRLSRSRDNGFSR